MTSRAQDPAADVSGFDDMLAQLGAIPVPLGGDQAAPSDGQTPHLPALDSGVGAIRNLYADVIAIAASVIKGANRSRARAMMRKRLVMTPDGSAPAVVLVSFDPKVIRDREGNAIAVNPTATLAIAGTEGQVEAQPLIVRNVDYLAIQDIPILGEDGEPTTDPRLVSNGQFACVVFRPKKGADVYKLLPIGLCKQAVLDRWNQVAKAMPARHWPIVDHISSDLHQTGTRTDVLIPQTCEDKTFKGKGKQPDQVVWYIGYKDGKMLRLHPSSPQPVTSVVDGKEVWDKEQVFRVHEGEGSIELHWLRMATDADAEPTLVPVTEIVEDINPFAALGLTPNRADGRKTRDEARRLLARPLQPGNALYDYGLAYDLVAAGTDPSLAKGILGDLAHQAATQVTEILDAQFRTVTASLANWTDRPTMAEILMGKLLKVVGRRVQKEDVAGAWIGSKVEGGKFDPKSPFHLRLRGWLIRQVAEAEGYEDPKPAKAADKPADATGGSNGSSPPADDTADAEGATDEGAEDPALALTEDALPVVGEDGEPASTT